MAADRMELGMRIEGIEAPSNLAAAERALAALDPAATLRVDASSGIVRVATACQALEIEEALTRAGLRVTAATG